VTETEIKTHAYNKAVIAGSILLIPTLTFWIVVFLYSTLGIGNRLMGVFAGLERSQVGIVVMVTLVIGCPFFALPLTVIGRWLARVKGQKGIRLGSAVLAVCVILLVLGLALPLGLR
jgi:uncharacterized membrane protein YadS